MAIGKCCNCATRCQVPGVCPNCHTRLVSVANDRPNPFLTAALFLVIIVVVGLGSVAALGEVLLANGYH